VSRPAFTTGKTAAIQRPWWGTPILPRVALEPRVVNPPRRIERADYVSGARVAFRPNAECTECETGRPPGAQRRGPLARPTADRESGTPGAHPSHSPRIACSALAACSSRRSTPQFARCGFTTIGSIILTRYSKSCVLRSANKRLRTASRRCLIVKSRIRYIVHCGRLSQNCQRRGAVQNRHCPRLFSLCCLSNMITATSNRTVCSSRSAVAIGCSVVSRSARCSSRSRSSRYRVSQTLLTAPDTALP
jgi:hypothetical protein